MRNFIGENIAKRDVGQWLSEKDVARLIGISVSSLQKHRFKRSGIPYVKLGRTVRYSLADVYAYMDTHKIKL